MSDNHAVEGPTMTIDKKTGTITTGLHQVHLRALHEKPQNFSKLCICVDVAITKFFGTDGRGMKIMRSDLPNITFEVDSI